MQRTGLSFFHSRDGPGTDDQGAYDGKAAIQTLRFQRPRVRMAAFFFSGVEGWIFSTTDRKWPAKNNASRRPKMFGHIWWPWAPALPAGAPSRHLIGSGSGRERGCK